MKILIGTTNPSKVKRFEQLLSGCDAEFFTLNDFHIEDEPEENGQTPEENAILKARFYGQFFDTVICHDSGLYFDALPLDDSRQPGLSIRTPDGGARLDDEEMIAYYSALIRSLGGKVLAFYLDGFAIYHNGKITSFSETANEAKEMAFYMIDRPSQKRRAGWPLDSLSLSRDTMTYFLDERPDERPNLQKDGCIHEDYLKRVTAFLKDALELN